MPLTGKREMHSFVRFFVVVFVKVKPPIERTCADQTDNWADKSLLLKLNKNSFIQTLSTRCHSWFREFLFPFTPAHREPFLGVILATQKLLIIAHRMLGNYGPADYI